MKYNLGKPVYLSGRLRGSLGVSLRGSLGVSLRVVSGSVSGVVSGSWAVSAAVSQVFLVGYG